VNCRKHSIRYKRRYWDWANKWNSWNLVRCCWNRNRM